MWKAKIGEIYKSYKGKAKKTALSLSKKIMSISDDKRDLTIRNYIKQKDYEFCVNYKKWFQNEKVKKCSGLIPYSPELNANKDNQLLESGVKDIDKYKEKDKDKDKDKDQDKDQDKDKDQNKNKIKNKNKNKNVINRASELLEKISKKSSLKKVNKKRKDIIGDLKPIYIFIPQNKSFANIILQAANS